MNLICKVFGHKDERHETCLKYKNVPDFGICFRCKYLRWVLGLPLKKELSMWGVLMALNNQENYLLQELRNAYQRNAS